ncbi:trehalase-like [Planococcus citri]|uniref:trehalase-like n=1 Tax=Planococcus citri TaxID=170843 RepID=UPI0031F9E7DF
MILLLVIQIIVTCAVVSFTNVHSLTISTPQVRCETGCQSRVYCTGDLLNDVQVLQVYANSKEFVDMKLLSPEDTIVSAYRQFKASNTKPTKEELKSFLDRYFAPDPLEKCQLQDYNENAAFLQSIADENYKNWILNVMKIWKELAGKIPADVQLNPQNHSYLFVPKCFIKAGGFFTEMYYWDSYWIIQGLLLCDMSHTARGILENFFHLVRTLGYVPNGNRKYYIGRSQPPLLTRMVDYYLSMTNDQQFVLENLELLEIEFAWWQKNRMIDVTAKNGKTYKMARYACEICQPRPEGYLTDYKLAQQLDDGPDRQKLLVSLRSSAESGWDFSSKQMKPGYRRTDDPFSMLNLDTQNIVMVDLNAMLHFNVAKLAQWYECLNNPQKSSYYKQIADDLFEAIQEVLWNEEDGVWYDWDLVSSSQRKNFYPSNLTPLWTKSFKKCQVQAERILKYLANEKIISDTYQPLYYGIPTSKCNTTQQWDFVNEWAPLQAIMIEGLLNLEDPKTDTLAFAWSSLWLKTNYEGFKKTGNMYEKYSAIIRGESGNGGEYLAQIGFGWSNGFAINLMHKYGKIVASDNYDDFIPAPAPRECSLLNSSS